MPHYNEICIEKTIREKKTAKAKNKNCRQNPNYTNSIFPNYTAEGLF